MGVLYCYNCQSPLTKVKAGESCVRRFVQLAHLAILKFHLTTCFAEYGKPESTLKLHATRVTDIWGEDIRTLSLKRNSVQALEFSACLLGLKKVVLFTRVCTMVGPVGKKKTAAVD